MNTATKQKITQLPAKGLRRHLFTCAMLLLMGAGTGLISMMLGASHYGMPMFYSYFASPLLVLLNLLPPVLLMFFVYFACGRVWIAFLATALSVLLLSTVSFLKVQVRGEPFVAADVYLAGEVGKVMTGYALVINWKIYFAAAFVICGTIFSIFLMRSHPSAKTRFIGAAAVLLASVFLYSLLYTNEKIYEASKGGNDINIWSDTEKSIARGFLYPFIYSFHHMSPQPPVDYGKDEAVAALSVYGDDSIADGKKVNIVSIMLESYADLSTWGAVDFNVDVYGALHALQKESLYGSLVVNVFAGGTIDTERSFLSGSVKPGDFQTAANSYVRYLGDQGYYTEGVHVGDSWYYDRKKVNANMGFDNYYFLEDFEKASRWDAFFFPTVIKMYESRDPGIPYFSYNLSYQNHGPYDSTSAAEMAYIKQGGLSEASYKILNNYLSGIYDTTQRLAAFVDYFRGLDEPVVIVVFGDHKPWLGNDFSVYNELGINIDPSTEEGFYNFYTTPYLIWANSAAKETLEDDFTGYGGNFSPCFLMNTLFDRCSWGGDAFMKAADEFRRYTAVINTATGYFSENGVLTEALSDEADGAYKKFQEIEYYRQHNYIG